MIDKSTYPRAFMTPAGQLVSVRSMAAALRRCHANPDRQFAGWEWYEVSGREILRDFMRGLNDRINRRDE